MRLVLRLFGAASLIVLVAMVWGWYSMQSHLDRALSIDAAQSVEIAAGSHLKRVLQSLRDEGVTDNIHWVLLHARLDPTAAEIKAGRYTLTPGMTLRDMLAKFTGGDVDLERLTIVEGWTAAEAIAAVTEHPSVRDDLGIALDARNDGAPWLTADDHAELAVRLGINDSHIEGWLFPDTYRFAAGTPASALLQQAHHAMVEQVAEAWGQQAPAPQQLASAYEMLILASIIEKETSRDDERHKIAGVFVRRLAKSIRLQTDPTVIYGIGLAYDGDIRRSDLQRETPYNTYRIDRLPPTPIALPGRQSLHAAVAPAPGEALFFVATGEPDGSHYFSRTLDEHELAVKRYLQRLRDR